MSYVNGDKLPDRYVDPPQTPNELTQKLYDESEISLSAREQLYQVLSRLSSQSRPDSFISCQSTSSGGTRSDRSAQSSVPSSRTSYCSNTSTISRQSSVVPPSSHQLDPRLLGPSLNVQNLPASLSRRLQKRFHPHVAPRQRSQKRIELAATSGQGDITLHVAATELLSPCLDDEDSATNPGGRSRSCPWCATTCKKQHDFKRHVKNHCCGRRSWVCRNPSCQHSSSQEQHAREHRDRNGNLNCKQEGWTVIELQCERKHFGCPYCAGYFNDLDKFIDHLGQTTCRPDKGRGKGHRPNQIRALLEQPQLKPHVEALGEELRGYSDAYKGLWWLYSHEKLFKLLEKLEYGLKIRVDQQNPGISYGELETFLRALIQPSSKSVWGYELVQNLQADPLPRGSKSKPLPPDPPSTHSSPAPKAHRLGNAAPNPSYDSPHFDYFANGSPLAEEYGVERPGHGSHIVQRQQHQPSRANHGPYDAVRSTMPPSTLCAKVTGSYYKVSDVEEDTGRLEHDPYLWDALMVDEDTQMVTEESWNPTQNFDDFVTATDSNDFLQDLIYVSPVDSSCQAARCAGRADNLQSFR